MPKCGSTSWSVAFAEANKMDNYKDYLNGKLTHFCPTVNICALFLQRFFFWITQNGTNQNENFQLPVQTYLLLPLRQCSRGVFSQFPFRWIYYYGSNKSTGKETGKTHLLTQDCCPSISLKQCFGQ